MPLKHKCNSTYFQQIMTRCRIQHSRHTRLYSNSYECFVWVIYPPERCGKMGGIFAVFYFATYRGPQSHVSLHCSFVLAGFVRRDVWMKTDLNSALLLGLGSKRIGSHRRISAKASMTLVMSLMKTFWTFWSSAFHRKRNNDPAFEKGFEIARDGDINHCYTSLQAVRNEIAFNCVLLYLQQ